jgi:hypothetical protein
MGCLPYWQPQVYHMINFMTASVMSWLAFTSRVVDRGFQPRSGQTKDHKIGICCFFIKHAALGRKSKDWLARNQDNVSEWGDMSIHGLLFQWATGLTKPGKVGEVLALYQLKSPSLDSKAKLKSPCFFLQVAPYLQIICVLWLRWLTNKCNPC